jgi:hypothetical protein
MKASVLHCGLALTAVCTLLLSTGCTSTASSPATTDQTDGVDWQAQIAEYSAMDPAALESVVRTLGASVERKLMTLSGLEEELGGAAAADAAFAELNAAMTSATQRFTSQPNFGRFAANVPGADEAAMGGLVFGTMMIVQLGTGAAVGATNDLKAGDPSSETAASDDGAAGNSSYTVSGSTDKAKLDVGVETTKAGLKGTLTTVITVAPCPDPTGRFTATTKMSASVSRAGGATGWKLAVEATVTGRVGDDAQLVTSDMDMRTQAARFESRKGMFLDLNLTFGQVAGSFDVTGVTINRMNSTVTEDFAREQTKLSTAMALVAKEKSLEAAKKGWESGRCVKLVPTTTPAKRTGLEPSSTVTILAAPRSKVDGLPTGGTVQATRAGQGSVDPADTKVPADATFVYTAPGEKDQKGAVFLESRSKRGVGKAELYFDTKAGGYAVDQPFGSPGGRIHGSICSLDKPFTLDLEIPAVQMTGTFSFTPAGDSQGSWRYAGTAMGGAAKDAGSGSYSVEGVTEDKPTIKMDGGTWKQTTAMGTYDSPGGPGQALVLTPAAAGCEK